MQYFRVNNGATGQCVHFKLSPSTAYDVIPTSDSKKIKYPLKLSENYYLPFHLFVSLRLVPLHLTHQPSSSLSSSSSCSLRPPTLPSIPIFTSPYLCLCGSHRFNSLHRLTGNNKCDVFPLSYFNHEPINTARPHSKDTHSPTGKGPRLCVVKTV